MTTRIGISGWRYPPWRGTFYPQELPASAELRYASARLPIIELNGSFYSLQRPESYASWYADTPERFVFSIKAPRYITHIRRLRDVQAPLANFLASGLFNLKEKLGPILWQFPPFFRFDADRFETFLKLLPHDTEHAARIAHGHDVWMSERAQLNTDACRPLRHAVEIRHDSFMVPQFSDLLRRYGVAFVVAESAREWPMTLEITADFVYMRLHGDKELYKSGYSDKSLERWAARILDWQKTMDVYCFFDNTDVKLRAPFDAQSLMRKLGVVWTPEGSAEAAGTPGRKQPAARRKAGAPGARGPARKKQAGTKRARSTTASKRKLRE